MPFQYLRRVQPLPGQTRYRTDGPLGVGPDGPVHRALADRLGARPVAVRRIHAPVGAARAALRRDAETIATLGHRGLAVVDDIVDVDDETVLVASTLGTNGTLADRLVLGPIPVDDAVDLVRTVADALDSAHRIGLAHGRVSASNVLLTDDGPVLCDLVQSAAVHGVGPGEEAVAADAAALIHLAALLVDGADRSPRAAAYRSLCRWSAESCTDLTGFVVALSRLDAPTTEAPTTEAPTPGPDAGASSTTTAATPRSDHAALGLVVSVSLVIGTLIGVAGTLLPIG